MALFRLGIGRGIQPLSKQDRTSGLSLSTCRVQNISGNPFTLQRAASHTRLKARHRSSFISDGLLGIIVNNGNLAPAMTENVSEIRLLHIYSGYMSLEWNFRQMYLVGYWFLKLTCIITSSCHFPPVPSVPHPSYWE